MNTNNSISSERLHLRVKAFCALFVALVASFEPMSAFVLALLTLFVLSEV
ncbi:MAG: hypothetical protein PHD53_10790 [Methylococcales bacterium]|nr:hypothetical protein [Methylococcales bacterium]